MGLSMSGHNLKLLRIKTGDDGTIGKLFTDEDLPVRLAFTCERPWKNNASDISCIPQGTYKVIRHHSEKFPDAFELVDVPGRVAILIHNGNTMMDTDGCILVGDSQGVIKGLPAVLNSKATLARLLADQPDTFNLTITGVV